MKEYFYILIENFKRSDYIVDRVCKFDVSAILRVYREQRSTHYTVLFYGNRRTGKIHKY